jgi:hypothetical protein
MEQAQQQQYQQQYQQQQHHQPPSQPVYQDHFVDMDSFPLIPISLLSTISPGLLMKCREELGKRTNPRMTTGDTSSAFKLHAAHTIDTRYY